MNKMFFGELKNNEEIHKYILKNSVASLTLTDFGAAIVSFDVYGKDIVGGYDNLEDYLVDDSHQGATIGRVANRIANAEFTMDSVVYRLPKNDGENCLHGGNGFDRRVWSVKEYTDNKITFTYTAKDKEEGFPGALEITVSYTLVDSSIIINYTAIPDKKTPIALTNHSYFNLNGFGDTILTHKAQIFADTYTEVDESLIPNGKHPSVEGTVFDLRAPKAIGTHVGEDFVGYDHNFVLSPSVYENFGEKKLALAAIVTADELSLSVYTDQPGIQFYIGNFLGGAPDFKNGVKRVRHGAFCLETQTEPNCINSGVGFYEKGDIYTHTTVYKVGKI